MKIPQWLRHAPCLALELCEVEAISILTELVKVEAAIMGTDEGTFKPAVVLTG